MAIVDTALCPVDCCQRAGAPGTAGVKSRTPLLVAASVILCSILLAGCARNPAPREVSPTVQESKPTPVRTAVRPRRYPEPYRYVAPKIRRPDLALLSPQPAPDCEFNRSDLKTVDPNEWARLKVEYERQCYLDAEKAARDRLALLQASAACEVEPPPQRSPARRQSAQPR